MSLLKVHPLWSSAGSSPMHVSKALVQAQMLSGRYRCGALTKHWTKGYDGSCLLDTDCANTEEDIHHILSSCPALDMTRGRLLQFTFDYSSRLPESLSSLLLSLCHPGSPQFCHFLLDCSALPSVISLAQIQGEEVLQHLFFISRTWIFALHRERLKRLGIWKQSGRSWCSSDMEDDLNSYFYQIAATYVLSIYRSYRPSFDLEPQNLESRFCTSIWFSSYYIKLLLLVLENQCLVAYFQYNKVK